jgi:putative tryptophan/tyrosine transport system substrate-binding protein
MNNRRRIVLAVGAGALAAPLASFAQQQPAKIARIGFLGLGSATSSYAIQMDALRAGLRDLGYVEGKNIVIEYRWVDGKYDRLPELAAELVRLKVEVLVTHGTPGVLAAKGATTTTPIVMAAVADPVANGLVASLARPGGNVTGCSYFAPELHAKRLELLKRALPRVTLVAALLNPDNASIAPLLKETRITADLAKVRLQQFDVRGPGEFESAFSAMAKGRIDAVVVFDDPMLIANRGAIADLAAKHRIPSVGQKEFAEAGGLMGYGQILVELFRRTAYFVDRILKGAKPADLPVEQASRFEMVVNMKTAKALGVTITQSVLARAVRIIE